VGSAAAVRDPDLDCGRQRTCPAGAAASGSSWTPLGPHGPRVVLLALLLQRHLQNMSNRVIASLAVTDFLLALVVVPLSIYQLVTISAHPASVATEI